MAILKVVSVNASIGKVNLVSGDELNSFSMIDISLFPSGEQYNLTAPSAIGGKWEINLSKYHKTIDTLTDSSNREDYNDGCPTGL